MMINIIYVEKSEDVKGLICVDTAKSILSQISEIELAVQGTKRITGQYSLSWTSAPQEVLVRILILFYKIINGLAQVHFEGILVEVYKGTTRKHNMKFRQIGHTTIQYGQSFFPKTISAWNRLAFVEALSLAGFRF